MIRYCIYNKTTSKMSKNSLNKSKLKLYRQIKFHQDIYAIAKLTFDDKGRFIKSIPDLHDIPNLKEG